MSLKEHTYVVILAGGVGKRFVPYSTPEKPKQFLPITHPSRTMIQETYGRISALVLKENCFVSTNERYIQLARKELPQIPPSNIVGEPLMKNTAPAIAFLAAMIASRDSEAIMVVLPSDHFIENAEAFIRSMKQAVLLANKGEVLVTLGIVPTDPSTDYGYIKRGPLKSGEAYSVERFVEKPDIEKAREYLKDGNYYWNSGMFVWRVDTFMSELKRHAPEIAALLDRTDVTTRQFFEAATSISIDYALLEKTDRICVIPLDAGWSDVGGWNVVSRLYDSGKIKPPDRVISYLQDKSATEKS